MHKVGTPRCGVQVGAARRPYQNLSRNDSDGSGSATVPVALVGVSPASRTMILPTPFGAGPKDGKVFGETPKTAVETTALPKATASFRLSCGPPGGLSRVSLGMVTPDLRCRRKTVREKFFHWLYPLVLTCTGLYWHGFALGSCRRFPASFVSAPPIRPMSRSEQDARQGPALAGREPGTLSQLGAGALHGTHFTTYSWECK